MSIIVTVIVLIHSRTWCCAPHILIQVNKYAFSGGQDTVEDHRKYGGDVTVDIAYQYLTFFLEDDAKLSQIKEVGALEFSLKLFIVTFF